MSLIEAMAAAGDLGTLRESFALDDVAAAIQRYQYGSIQAALSSP